MLKKQKYGKKMCAYDFLPYMLSFGLTVGIMFVLYYKNGFAPFGDTSFATKDADIQYLDLFSYFKDVLSGDNSILYTFGKGLGGTCIAVFSYYLSSPFNLLVIFFKKENMVLFFDILVVLKLATASLTATFFLRERFRGKLNNCFVVLLAVSYALMQYSIAQSCNIMWLDGVYMLPLMLLGVYRIINGKRSNMLIFSTGLAILFNWYSAGINCLFTIMWFVFEWLLAMPENDTNAKGLFKDTAKKIGKYILSMLLGVMLSAALFLPSMYALISGGRGGLDSTVLNNEFKGNIINIPENLTIGSISSKGSVSLYCGSLAILGCIMFFISQNKTFVKKVKTGAMLALSLLIFYWNPLVSIFSLFKDVKSYWYRYSYVTIFLIIFIAADYYSGLKREKNSAKQLLKVAVLYSAVIMEVTYLDSGSVLKNAYYTCICFVVIAALTAFFAHAIKQKSKYSRIPALFLIGALSLELMYNANLLMDNYSKGNASKYQNYSISQQEQISDIQEEDTGFYRINQTKTYNTSSKTGLTANYNEAFAYNYSSVVSYTSDPDNSQRNFLDKLGYPICGNNITVVDTSILTADSLLGVKYVLSSYEINGLELLDSYGTYNGKNVYYNPYVLPMAFVYRSDAYTSENEEEYNPFEYQNILYSELLGEEVQLYEEAEFEAENDGNGVVNYTIKIPEGNYALYGNIFTSFNLYLESYKDTAGSPDFDGKLNVDDTYTISYSGWISPTVFYIPTTEGDEAAGITFSYEADEENTIIDEQFYVLNLDTLSDVTEKISSREADEINIQNGYAEFEVEGNEGESLYISIPYNEGWIITLNGTEIEPELFEDCMISVALTSGTNIIKMEYKVPYLKVGIVISLIALVLIIINNTVRRKRDAVVNNNSVL